MNMYMCMKINCINSPFIKLMVMASLCSHYFIGFAGLPRRTTGISGLWASICTILLPNHIFPNLSNGNQICQNHESMLSDVHIGEKAPYIHFSVIVTVCRGPCALGIYSTHGTPSFMHPLWLQKRNSGCILPLSYALKMPPPHA